MNGLCDFCLQMNIKHVHQNQWQQNASVLGAADSVDVSRKKRQRGEGVSGRVVAYQSS